jgi:DnaJ-class molecular chaperone
MNNFYSCLEISPNSTVREILMAYENKITKFFNLNKLSPEQISEIKMLKISLYVLTNPELKLKYDNFLKKPQQKQPVAINEENENNLDSLFNIDNTWMKNNSFDSQINDKTRKKILSDNLISDRVFSLPELNKRPGFSHDFEASLRKPEQGRQDKSEKLLNEFNKI